MEKMHVLEAYQSLCYTWNIDFDLYKTSDWYVISGTLFVKHNPKDIKYREYEYTKSIFECDIGKHPEEYWYDHKKIEK